MKTFYMWDLFTITIRQEFLLAYRCSAEFIYSLLFFIIILSLFCISFSGLQNILPIVAPGILWVTVLLSILLSLNNLFRTEFYEGSLETLLLSPQPLALIVLAKLIAHWVMAILPLILLSPLFAVMLHMPTSGFVILILGLLLGTPALVFIGAVGRALTLGLRNSNVLLTLLILPLYIPILIFGTGAVTLAIQGLSVRGELAWLASLFFCSVALAPIAVAAALRNGGI